MGYDDCKSFMTTENGYNCIISPEPHWKESVIYDPNSKETCGFKVGNKYFLNFILYFVQLILINNFYLEPLKWIKYNETFKYQHCTFQISNKKKSSFVRYEVSMLAMDECILKCKEIKVSYFVFNLFL